MPRCRELASHAPAPGVGGVDPAEGLAPVRSLACSHVGWRPRGPEARAVGESSAERLVLLGSRRLDNRPVPGQASLGMWGLSG